MPVEPTDSLTLRLIADYSEEKSNCCYGQVDDVDGPLQPFINLLTQARGLGPPSAEFDDYEQVLSNDTQQDLTGKGVVLQADWEFGGHSARRFPVWRSGTLATRSEERASASAVEKLATIVVISSFEAEQAPRLSSIGPMSRSPPRERRYVFAAGIPGMRVISPWLIRFFIFFKP